MSTFVLQMLPFLVATPVMMLALLILLSLKAGGSVVVLSPSFPTTRSRVSRSGHRLAAFLPSRE